MSIAQLGLSSIVLRRTSNNIGQLAYLQSEKHQLERIYFGGSFIGGHRQTIKTLSYAINFWSDGSKRAYFLRHEGTSSRLAICTPFNFYFFLKMGEDVTGTICLRHLSCNSSLS